MPSTFRYIFLLLSLRLVLCLSKTEENMSVSDPSIFVEGQKAGMAILPDNILESILSYLHMATEVSWKMGLCLTNKQFDRALTKRSAWKLNKDLLFCPLNNNLFVLNGKRFNSNNIDEGLRVFLQLVVIENLVFNSQICHAMCVYPLVQTFADFRESFNIKDINVNFDGLQNPSGVGLLINGFRGTCDTRNVLSFTLHIRSRVANDHQKTKTLMRSTVWSFIMGCSNLRNLDISSSIARVVDVEFLYQFLYHCSTLKRLAVCIPDSADPEDCVLLADAMSKNPIEKLALNMVLENLEHFFDNHTLENRLLIRSIAISLEEANTQHQWSQNGAKFAKKMLEIYPNAEEVDLNFTWREMGWDLRVIIETVVNAFDVVMNRNVRFMCLKMRCMYPNNIVTSLVGVHNFESIELLSCGVYKLTKGRAEIKLDLN